MNQLDTRVPYKLCVRQQNIPKAKPVLKPLPQVGVVISSSNIISKKPDSLPVLICGRNANFGSEMITKPLLNPKIVSTRCESTIPLSYLYGKPQQPISIHKPSSSNGFLLNAPRPGIHQQKVFYKQIIPPKIIPEQANSFESSSTSKQSNLLVKTSTINRVFKPLCSKNILTLDMKPNIFNHHNIPQSFQASKMAKTVTNVVIADNSSIRQTERLPQVDGIVDVDLDEEYGPNPSALYHLSKRPKTGNDFGNIKTWRSETQYQKELALQCEEARRKNSDRLYQIEQSDLIASFSLRFVIDNVGTSFINPNVAWQQVVKTVSDLRKMSSLPDHINTANVNGWKIFGLNHRHVAFLIEQMLGAHYCYRHQFLYHWKRVERIRSSCLPAKPNPEGSIRLVPWNGIRRPKRHIADPLDFLRCKANPPPERKTIKTDSNAQNSNVQTSTQKDNIISPHKAVLTPQERLRSIVASFRAARRAAAELKVGWKHSKVQYDRAIISAVSQATVIPVDFLTRVLDKPDDPTPLLEFDGQNVEEERRENMEIEHVDEDEEEDSNELNAVGQILNYKFIRYHIR